MSHSRTRATDVRSRRRTGVPRVLFVSSHAQDGGSERVLLDLVDALPSEVVAGVVALQSGPLVARAQASGTSVEVLATSASPLSMAASALALTRLVRGAGADVVHANGVKAAIVSTLVGRRVPVVWMKHDVSLDGAVGRAVARCCARVACVSREVAHGVGRSGRAVVVHPGVALDPARAVPEGRALRERLRIEGPVVTVMGRLDPAKGHAELVEALPALRREVPGITALLAGTDDVQHPGHRDALRRRAAELGVEAHLRLPGHVPAREVLAASDVVCIPTVPRADGSGREGFGLVAAEALVLGVPVVGYDVGATREVVGPCGVLVAPLDRTALAGAVVRLLSDDDHRAAAARCGRERASRFTVHRMADQMLALYQGVAR